MLLLMKWSNILVYWFVCLLLNYHKLECIGLRAHKFQPSAISCQLIDLKKIVNISTVMTIQKMFNPQTQIMINYTRLGQLWIQY